jgi:UDP-galactopyranose mutase
MPPTKSLPVSTVSPRSRALDASTLANPTSLPSKLICFSHLRWDFVYQRPQHLLSRFAKMTEVTVLEEPIHDAPEGEAFLVKRVEEGVTIAVPHVPAGTTPQRAEILQRQLLDGLVKNIDLEDCAFWYYTPMALGFSAHLRAGLTVYDCMDELAAFKFAPPRLVQLEDELFNRADVVFTGGRSLYRAKKDKHPNVHAFPSSIERAHFGKARTITEQPADQAVLPAGPKLGFYGVIDERFDLDLIRDAAAARPQWQFVLIGPVVKIDPATLPQAANIHYLGGKTYDELPAYLSGWDVALIPFAINDSTKYISPTKTPEYLAAGIPVVSTPITDVVTPYGRQGLVHIAANAEVLVPTVDSILAETGNRTLWLQHVDAFLADNSWDLTQKKMAQQMVLALQERAKKQTRVYSKVA